MAYQGEDTKADSLNSMAKPKQRSSRFHHTANRMTKPKWEVPLGRHHSRADTSSCRQHLGRPREALEPSLTPGSGPSLVEDLPLPAHRIYCGPNDSDNPFAGAPRVYYHKASNFLLWEASEDGKFTTVWWWKDRSHPAPSCFRSQSERFCPFRKVCTLIWALPG